MTEERKLKIGDVVQIQNDENLPKEFIGCLGYVMNVDNQADIVVRIYQPKVKGDYAEFTEESFPSISLTFVGTVPADMQPL
jgi:hypothetical protein